MAPRRAHPARTANPPKTPRNKARKRKSLTRSIPLDSFLVNFSVLPPRVSSTARPGKNKRNKRECSYHDILHPVATWTEFSLASCITKFGAALEDTQVHESPVEITPQKDDDEKAVSSELGVAEFTVRALTAHLNRGLRACRYRLLDRPGHEVAGIKADRIGLKFPAREIRVVGDTKVSWKWRSEWRHAPLDSHHDLEYRQVLSQVHSYMNANGCEWGYVLTDREFVAVERGDVSGDIRVGEAVAWEASGSWNVAFATSFLHALAAGDEWHQPQAARSRSAAVAQAKRRVGATGTGPRRSVRVAERAKRVM
ncbi:hypothetical protein FN846DRAFT_922551 [Sphaerosporella brunnea]|uniref:Uncharacterized protein n=1 Tax=Sphaerosporella brunnea TaxID=1250544 RepID=A0A5J5EJG1_9PEZI|nr:hypothetical protein FN846DRAFT_922551 [Sphaerosporella brunnea]